MDWFRVSAVELIVDHFLELGRRDAEEKEEQEEEARAKKDKEDGRPVIFISTDEMPINDAGIAALALRDTNIYQRAESLVTIIQCAKTKSKEGIRRPAGPRIKNLVPAVLRERLSASARYLKPSAGKPPVPSHPPDYTVAQSLAVATGWIFHPWKQSQLILSFGLTDRFWRSLGMTPTLDCSFLQ